MRRKRWLWPAAAAVCCAIAFVAGWRMHPAARQDQRLAELERENADLRARLARAEKPAPPAAREQPAPASPHEHAAAPPPGPSAADAHALETLRATLADANASVAHLQARVQELDTQVQKLSVDNKRLTASESDLNDNLSSANALIEALQKENKTKGDRIVQLEIAYQKIREQGGADAQKLQQTAQLTAQLQEIDRRRAAYLASILRRYRDLTDQYRNLSAMLENRRQNEPVAVAGTDLSRIQNTIAMADEDLRQLAALNAQAERVQKKLAGK